jgi:hypothetical protein
MRRKKLIHVFCDESGFTGNKLLDAEQEVFTYAAAAIEPGEAAELVEQVKRDFRLQGRELKGSTLLGRTQGKKAITEILKRCDGRYRVVAHLKPYALASKFFEYIFERAMSDFNSFLYGVNFHRYISTILYVYFRAENKSAETLLEDFTKFAHRGDTTALEAIFPMSSDTDYRDDVLHAIGMFALLHKEAIKNEVLSFREPGVPNWILDLTTTSAFSLLAWWGQRAKELEVVCDESKPIKGDIRVFDAMVNRPQTSYVRFQNKERPFSFNLKSPLKLASSLDNPGLQIADVLASVTAHVWRNTYRGIQTAEGRKWQVDILKHMDDDSIWPDFDHADLSTPGCFANTILLQELISRSIAGQDLFEGLPQVFRGAYRLHSRFLAENAALISSRASRSQRAKRRGN